MNDSEKETVELLAKQDHFNVTERDAFHFVAAGIWDVSECGGGTKSVHWLASLASYV